MKSMHIPLLILALAILSCDPPKKDKPTDRILVEIGKEQGEYQLMRDGEPYFVKGAVGWSFFEELEAAGANSLRSSPKHLDTAYKHGLTMLVNIPMKAERAGFDYGDAEAVQAQFERAEEMVLKYKDHPGVLMWAIGNELDHIPGNPNYNLDVWDAVNDVAKMIHQVDGNHPCLTVVGIGEMEKLLDIKERCPDLDLIGINGYAAIEQVPEYLDEFGWEKPFLVTEWGPSGWWEVPRTKWGVVIEESSAEKARVYRERYEKIILGDPRCVGSYVFLWTSNRQERTHTWFNMFHDDLKTQTVEVMQYMWTGEWPENRAPRVSGVTINGMKANDHVVAEPGKEYVAEVDAIDPDGDRLSISWELLPEPEKFGAYAGQGEVKPEPVEGFILEAKGETITFQVPQKSAENYRLFAYVKDGKGNIGVANIAFHCEE